MSVEEIKLAIAFVLLVGAAGVSSWVTHQVDNAAYTKLELSYTQAEEKAVQTALDNQTQLDEIKTQVALEDAQKQRKLVAQTKGQLNNVKKYIKDTCITFGMFRLYNSTILGTDPSSVSLPSGKSDDSCTGLTAVDLANSFVNNIGIEKLNAQQLDDLIGALHRMYDKKDIK